MHILRGIVIFLLGIGFAAGAYMSGLAQRLPDFLAPAERSLNLHDAGLDAAPILVRITAPLGGCTPFYRLVNRSGQAVFFSYSDGADDNGNRLSGGAVRVPPGAMLEPDDRGQREPDGGHVSADRLAVGPSGCTQQIVAIQFDRG